MSADRTDDMNTLAVLGLGLIGGSLALALRRTGAYRQIIGHDQDPGALARARAMGAIDFGHADLAEAVGAADMVVISVPPGSIEELMRRLAPVLPPSAIITDVASVKGEVVRMARQELAPWLPRFVPGHPIAGTEHNGMAAAFAELFIDHLVLLTPVPETSDLALARVRMLWQLSGAEVSCLDPEYHDQVLAATSHLPHVLAYTLVGYLAGHQDQEEIFRCVAGGFEDFTRIASSSPRMWRDVCFANRGQLLSALKGFQDQLASIQALIEAGEESALLELLQRAKNKRDQLLARHKKP